MSRTFRRKNYEETRNNSYDRIGHRTSGFYTVAERRIFCLERSTTIREPTREEFLWKYWNLHGDNSSLQFKGLRKFFKRIENKNLRHHSRLEILKWKKDEEYEPMFLTKFDPGLQYWLDID